MLKALVVSDIYVPDAKELSKNVDLVISCGDLYKKDLEIFDKPIFGVYGNHCDGKYLEELGATNLHLKVAEFNGLKLGGFQSCIDYKYQEAIPLYSQEEVDELLKDFHYVDIFVAHSPPFGLLDDPGDPVHTGFHAFRDYIEKHHPKYFLCGHLDPNEEMEYKGTKIIRTHGSRFLD